MKKFPNIQQFERMSHTHNLESPSETDLAHLLTEIPQPIYYPVLFFDPFLSNVSLRCPLNFTQNYHVVTCSRIQRRLRVWVTVDTRVASRAVGSIL